MKDQTIYRIWTTTIAITLGLGFSTSNAGNVANPCAANPCNPCSAGAKITTVCRIPRLVANYAKANPCNPCATKNPCNPCAGKNPCNPCAVKNPCNPCAGKNPGNPCAAGDIEPPELSDSEAIAAYQCARPHMVQAYRKSGHPVGAEYSSWDRFSKVSYPADAHGARFMNNYANTTASPEYSKWESAGDMPSGSVMAKDSFIVGEDGKISIGPLFIMSKAPKGSKPATRDWQYNMIMPDGKVRVDASLQKFCNDCHHRAGPEDDYLMFLPLPYRISPNRSN